MTHEEFIQAVRDCAIAYLAQSDPEAAQRLDHVKLCYGAGTVRLRGITYHNKWCIEGTKNSALIEIGAFAEQNEAQLSGTTLHELGHALAGPKKGHGIAWQQACAQLGLNNVQAVGTHYDWSMFASELRDKLKTFELTDGKPINVATKVHRCAAGIGSRGGKSRGVGSGSRLRKYVCGHGQIIRASTDVLQAVCGVCGNAFNRV